MSGFVPAPLATLPWRMLLLVIAIGGFGLVVLYSAAGGSLRPWVIPQGTRFAIFLVGAVVLSRVPLDWWKRSAFWIYAVILVLLVFVELLGAVRGGAQRWLGVGPIRIQPSELMKLAIVLAVARF